MRTAFHPRTGIAPIDRAAKMNRMKIVLGPLLAGGLFVTAAGCQPAPKPNSPMPTNSPASNPSPANASANRTDEEWKKILTPEQYRVLRQAGTERPVGPAYEEFKKQGGGTYVCAGCGAELFSSKEKFDSHCGWPSFYDPANARNVTTRSDNSAGMTRVEVNCAKCGGHLGHVFKGEGYATPTDTRYCINGVSLRFIPAGGTAANTNSPAR
jgi:peptide-methionine (R)-S-oxide reductase